MGLIDREWSPTARTLATISSIGLAVAAFAKPSPMRVLAGLFGLAAAAHRPRAPEPTWPAGGDPGLRLDDARVDAALR